MAASDPLAVTAEEAAAMAPGELEQVLAAWVKAGRAELPLALAAQAAGPQAKLAKKALYQLRSRGVPVEAPAGPTAPAPAAAAAAAEAELPGALSALLGTGERAVVFARPVRGGGLTVYQGVYSDEEGLLQLVATPSTRGEYRRRLAELRADPQVRTLEVSWARVRLELGQALWLADRAATPPPAQVMDLVRPLQLDPVDPAATPLPEPEEGDDRLAARAASLRQERELATEGLGVAMSWSRSAESGLIDQIQLDLTLPRDFPEKYRVAILRAGARLTVAVDDGRVAYTLELEPAQPGRGSV